MTRPVRRLSLDQAHILETCTEVSSAVLGGRILSCSDEWFAPASDLLKVQPAASLKGQFGPNGALFDGWETRRHNPSPADWVIVRLGPTGGASIVGFDVDTANFNGNEAPEVEIFGLCLASHDDETPHEGSAALLAEDPRWMPLLPRQACGPSQRHLFSIEPTSTVTHVKLNMIPDGGIARFRVYGVITPPALGSGFEESCAEGGSAHFNTLDLAHVLNGGRVVFTSDQHFGRGSNVLLPGRGKDMGDGWETKRSRAAGHKDWLVIKLGEPGLLSYCEIDTAHFLGNYPDSVEMHGTYCEEDVPPFEGNLEREASEGWHVLLAKSKVGPGKRHFFPLLEGGQRRLTHVRVIMHPDGGIKRVRIIGRRASPLVDCDPARIPRVQLPVDVSEEPQDPLNTATPAPSSAATLLGKKADMSSPEGTSMLSVSDELVVKAAPLTSALFSPFGKVIGVPPSSDADVTQFDVVNQGSARKYSRQAELQVGFPSDSQARVNVHLYRCASTPAASFPLALKMLERHRFSSQKFVPLATTGHPGTYLVVVAQCTDNDEPDLTSLRAFVAGAGQGILYHPGIWHLPMTPIGEDRAGSDQWLDFSCVVAESAANPAQNCDEHWWPGRSRCSIHL